MPRPQALRAGAAVPLLVMLHGCNQDAEGFAALTRMNRLAAKQGFAAWETSPIAVNCDQPRRRKIWLVVWQSY